MRKSDSAEILLLVSSAFCGIMVDIGDWWMIFIGGVGLFLISWFITPLLKTATIKEYIKAIQNTEDKKLNSEKQVKTCATKHVIPPKSKDSGILPNFI